VAGALAVAVGIVVGTALVGDQDVVSAVLLEVQLVVAVGLLGLHLVAGAFLAQGGQVVITVLGQVDPVAVTVLVDGGILVGAELATHLGAFPVAGGDGVAIALGVDGQVEVFTVLVGVM